MNLEKFTLKARDAIQTAYEMAKEYGHQEVEPEHLLLALCSLKDCLVPPLLKQIGVDLQVLSNNLEKEFTKKCQRLSELEKDKIKEEEELDKKVEEKLTLFLSSNGEATNYKDELVEKVKSDDSLKKMDDPFSYVWAEMVFDKIKNQKTSDEAVKNYILGNENLKNAVIESYINQLSENKSPIIISSNGNRVTTVATQNPANLDDAKKYLIDLLS